MILLVFLFLENTGRFEILPEKGKKKFSMKETDFFSARTEIEQIFNFIHITCVHQIFELKQPNFEKRANCSFFLNWVSLNIILFIRRLE